ncbi:hypothetical protein THRCLA_02365 [Thraustotheca clavata]|uniref:Cyclic nucleotide-binding domain-containing protein n=1 Tax=Thraustotheca clavata TaxID=74557 RepID=A0A1W0A5N5_9STRA|nr:hypothetical protein THRCLA_02365 [Thraustotheca clavata]
MAYKGPFATPPVRIGREVHHITGNRPKTARDSWLVPQRPFSAGCTNVPIQIPKLPRRPVTARKETMEERIARNIVPDVIPAIAEAALREKHQVTEADPLCGGTVEIRPLQAVQPRGTHNADYYRARDSGYQQRMKGNFTQAIEDYHNALKTAPRDFKTLFNLGIAYERIGNIDQAIATYKKACAVSWRNEFLHYNMGICYTLNEDFKRAIHSFTCAIEIDPKNPEFYKSRALAYRKSGQYTNAAKDYSNIGILTESLKLNDPNISNQKENLQLYHAKGGISFLQFLIVILNNFVSQLQTHSECAMYYYDSKPIYAPQHATALIASTLDDLDQRICFKIGRIPPDLRTPEDIQMLIDKTISFPTCRRLLPLLHRKLCQQIIAVKLLPHTVIYHEGEMGHFVFFVLQGKVDIFKLPMVKVGNDLPPRSMKVERESGSLEMQLSHFENNQLHRESTFIDNIETFDETRSAPLFTLGPGNEFGNQGRFRQLVRAVNAVTAEKCELLLIPWGVLEDYELEQAELESAKVADFLGKNLVFRYVAAPQLRILALKARWIRVPSGTVIQISGQHHEGLLIVFKGSCKLLHHDMLSTSPRHGSFKKLHKDSSGSLIPLKHIAKPKRKDQNARQIYLQIEHEDDPMHFVHANAALTSYIMANDTTKEETVLSQLQPRDFVGERSFLSNEGNERSFAKYSLVTTSYADILFIRKVDFFTETSYSTRQRVRTNIQKYHDDVGQNIRQHEAEAKQWARYKAKVVKQVIQDKAHR